MQHKFQNRFLFKQTKLEMMEDYWDWRLDDMTTKAHDRENEQM